MKSFRRWIANKLAALARRIYPQSEEVMSFYTDRMMDSLITGGSIVRVNPYDVYIDDKGNVSSAASNTSKGG